MAKTKCTKLTVDYRGGKLQFGIHPPTGQYRKKYKGHTLYLGAKPDGVLDQWLAKTDQLEIDLKASAALEGDSVTVKQLCDLHLSFSIATSHPTVLPRDICPVQLLNY